ncbi:MULTISPECIES: zinc-ribbon domain-containing protein [Chryseobacterium]|uniref:Zinc-ribbon domain-containing protein n=1 Tax=Chryseobacterium endophyticum TaxID=1854762 RepID=A0AAU6WUH3_9FLAO|nr:zinc-ribbon domain-containing protein [uncultured Chryseobacterium sp.]
MSLIKCPECSNLISDTALQCPKCGYSIKDNPSNIQKIIPKANNNQYPSTQKPNNGCVIAVLIFIVFGFLVFIVDKCSSSTSNINKDSATAIETNVSREDSIRNQARMDSIKKQEKIEEEKFMKTKAGKIYKKHPEWSKEDCINVSKNRIWIGMHYDMLVYERGRPDDVNTSNYGDGPSYQACWHDYQASCFYFDESQIITSYN